MKSTLVLFVLLACAVFASAQNIPATLSVDGKPVLQFEVPAASRLTATNGYLRINAPKVELYVLAVPGAKSIGDALPRAADLIKSEFVKFQPDATNDVKFAGIAAKDVTGPGNEADDQDEGSAEVVFFALQGRIFAACIHGDPDEIKPEHDPMFVLLNTLKAVGTSP